MKININDNSASSTCIPEWKSAYGKQVCTDGNVCLWRLKLAAVAVAVAQTEHRTSYTKMRVLIGVRHSHWSKSLHFTNRDIQSPIYAYAFIAGIAKLTTTNDTRGQSKYGEPFIAVGEEIDVILDLHNYTLSYIINGQHYGIAFHNLARNVKYRLAVSLCPGYTLQIIL
jgi:hypothetical protein